MKKQTVGYFKAGLSDAYRKQELREESCLRITRHGALGRSNLPKVEGHDRTDPVGEGNQHSRKPAYSKLVCMRVLFARGARSYAIYVEQRVGIRHRTRMAS